MKTCSSKDFRSALLPTRSLTKQDNRQWDAVLIYRTEYATDAEFAALQAYLDRGGTVIVDRPQSLSMDEYGKRRAARLRASAGNLITMGDKTDLEALKQAALAVAEPGLPDIRLIEENGTSHKGVTWRAVRQADGSWLVNALNIGKNAASLRIEERNGGPLDTTDLMTGKALGSQFAIERNGVLLLKVD